MAEYCERNPLELAGSAGYPDIVHFLQGMFYLMSACLHLISLFLSEGVVERRKKLYQKGRVSKRVSASPKSNTKRSPSPFAVSEQAITLPIDTYTGLLHLFILHWYLFIPSIYLFYRTFARQ